MLRIIANIGRYSGMMWLVFSKPQKFKIFWKRFLEEIQLIGVESFPIVMLMSVFMGGVISLQTAANMDLPYLPAYTIGYITRSSTILEFSPNRVTNIFI